MQTHNLDYINNLADGDHAFELEITTLLKKEFPKELELFYKKVEENDFLGIASSIHKIKYKFSLLGLKEDLIIASKFENEIKTGNKALFVKFESILHKLEQYLKTV
jgi:HPt (histidine-containing phosphotransfer) domain-containing protein|tara:strand:+ start:2393 stop:2710 length:318 start_codon:yes stop_codon:yes gene_type:complete